MAEDVKPEAPAPVRESVHMLTNVVPAGSGEIADQDYTEPLPDGRVIQHAAKGVAYPVGHLAAIRKLAGPSETKEDVVKAAPAEPKKASK